jgi:UDP-N-acetylglucosamine (GlcNAc):hydroxyproline polypeptide GlcNAc-transferase
MKTIFIQIASYRDEELPLTIASCLKNASSPERLRFGIFHQYGIETEHCLDAYKDDARFKITSIPWRESRGLGVARNSCEELYDNEDFTLQIDSHMRFVKNWDSLIIQEWGKCEFEKAVLTCYPPEYRYENGKEVFIDFPPAMMYINSFYQGFIPTFDSKVLPGKITKPRKVCFASGGFIFCKGIVCKEVPHDREISFVEEMAHSLRLFTYGYRMFCPTSWGMYHLYLRSKLGAHFFWSDFHEDLELKEQKIYEKMQDTSDAFQRDLLLNGNPDLLGKESSYEDFQNFSGINFKERLIHPSQLEGLEPPYATNSKWIDEVSPVKMMPVDITIDTSEFDMTLDYEFWYFALHDEENNELIRDDIKRNSWNVDSLHIKKEYPLRKVPKKYSVWPYSKSKGWLEHKIFPL